MCAIVCVGDHEYCRIFFFSDNNKDFSKLNRRHSVRVFLKIAFQIKSYEFFVRVFLKIFQNGRGKNEKNSKKKKQIRKKILALRAVGHQVAKSALLKS